jgi:hypothetical protein
MPFFRSQRFALALSTFVIALSLATPASAQSCLKVTPANLQINFPPKAINTQSLVQDVIIENTCAARMNINSFSFGPSAFKLLAGWAPDTVTENQMMTYEVVFAPTAVGTFTGNFTVNVQGYSPVVVTLTGTASLPGAIGSLSSSSLTFDNVPLGTTTAPQNVVLKNSGTKGFTIVNIYADPPFAVTGFTVNQVVKANSEITLPVTFSPSFAGSYDGTLVVTTNNLPPIGATLSGTAVAPTSLAITSFPTLPIATQKAAYLAPLESTNGIGTVTWSLASGSSLPAGLSLTSTGSITGTLASTVAVGKYPFSITATDSGAHFTTTQFTLPVAAPTGADCNNIDWDATGTTTPLVPLTDLGTGTYFGAEGGLYLNGSNQMPSGHDADGVGFAQSIQPLDSAGNPDPSGKFAMLSIGMSIAYDNFQTFVIDATADPVVNHQYLAFVPGAQPRVGAVDWANINHPAWTDIFDYFLPQSGVTAQQVVVAWVEAVDSQPKGSFPADMTTLQTHLESTAQNLHTLFPNLKMAFFNSREYAGYSNGLPGSGSNDPEPYAYESAFAVRGMIQDQINGVAAMNYNPANGPVVAPWVAWGPYTWANGMLPRSDGHVWACQNFEKDGTHTSQPGGGTEKVSNMLMNFMKNDDATAPWFLAPAAK